LIVAMPGSFGKKKIEDQEPQSLNFKLFTG
jgi:hypothetical protein